MALITPLEGQYIQDGEYYFKQTFRSLGQVMHLVSDMAVPAHVRNDSHPGPLLSWAAKSQKIDEYEKWVADHDGLIAELSGVEVDLSIFDNYVTGVSDAPSPISALFDQDRYNNGESPDSTWSCFLGLAEFTNANFYSQDTIHSDKYTYPNPSVFGNIDYANTEPIEAEDGEIDNAVYYVNQTHGYRMAQAGYFDYLLISRGFTPTLKLDDNVYMDYANILIPRAIGYSTALVDYFFRGRIDLESATSGDNAGQLCSKEKG